MESPWGWKDPRNTFTAEIWKNIFPDMKIIYLIRHPIDIADSLFRRQKKEVESDLQAKKKYSNVAKALLKINHTNYNSSMIINSHEDCFKLIDLYYNQILNNGIENSIIIRFEDILSNPYEEIKKIIRFCDMHIDEDILKNIIDKIRGSRNLAYKNNDELLIFESKFKELIEKMGFDK